VVLAAGCRKGGTTGSCSVVDECAMRDCCTVFGGVDLDFARPRLQSCQIPRRMIHH